MKKLIRNKIPTIAEQMNNRKGMTDAAFNDNDSELIQLFRAKIVEEANEVLEARNDIELKYEIADVVQVVHEFMCYLNITEKEIETIMKAKQYTHGTFINNIDEPSLPGTKRVTEVYVLDLQEDTDE